MRPPQPVHADTGATPYRPQHPQLGEPGMTADVRSPHGHAQPRRTTHKQAVMWPAAKLALQYGGERGCLCSADQDWMASTVAGPGLIPADVPPSAYRG